MQSHRTAPLVPTPTLATGLGPGTCTGFACDGDEKAPATAAPIKRDDDEPLQSHRTAPLVPTPTLATTGLPDTCTGFACDGDKIAEATAFPEAEKRDDDEPLQSHRTAPLVPTPTLATTGLPDTCTGFACNGDYVPEATAAPIKLNDLLV